MSYRIGNGYAGSGSLQTSTANQEIVPIPDSQLKWTVGYTFYKFSFNNEQACTVKINGGKPIYLGDNQGFDCDICDMPITSFVIVESGVSFNWIGAW